MIRKFISVASLIAISCGKKPVMSDSISLPAVAPPPQLIIPSQPAIKDLKTISINNVYEAFGILDYSRNNVYTYYYRRGRSHVTGGNPVYREYNALTKTWSDPVTISEDTRDGAVFGGRMDNDSTVLFLRWSNEDRSTEIQIIKADSNNRFSAPKAFNWAGIPRLQRQHIYGHVVKGDGPGEYFIPLYQTNIDNANSKRLLQCLYTSDYWDSYSVKGTIYDGTTPFSESSMINLGNGKLMALTRNDTSGTLVPFESDDYGKSWKKREISNLYWGMLRMPEIPFVYHDTATKTFDIIYQCRDANMVEISKYNDLTNFGNERPYYRDPEMYAYHVGEGTNPSLGYPSMIRMKDGNFLVVYSREYNDYRANIVYTEDDLQTDAGHIPPKPTITVSDIRDHSFRIEVTGYTDKQLENIRWLSEDLSEDSTFQTFTVCNSRSRSHPIIRMRDVRMTALWDYYSGLKTLTQYWLRIKACNYGGCSDYSVIKVMVHP